MTNPGPVRAASIQALKMSLVAGYPIIAVDTWEEDQALATIASFCRSVFGAEKSITTWDLQAGYCSGDTQLEAVPDAAGALDRIAASQETGFFVMKDIVPVLDRPEIARRIRNLHFSFRGQNRFLFLVGSDILIPSGLRKEIHLIDFGLPELAEIRELIERNLAAATQKGVQVTLGVPEIAMAAVALKGFTAAEAQHAMNKVLWNVKTIDAGILPALHREKEQMARKFGILEYVRVDSGIDDVGGLRNLKSWLEKRKRLFSPEAAAAGIRPPRGLLMMGISGCGKSLSVKAISSLWNIPLFRLDMNMVYSGMYGTPEGTFLRAIKSVESVSPAILWIDEIEGGISSATQKDGSTGSHIFSAFLTWMQEKSSDVFVAATANRIDLLPAEIIRKGRFDQVFFIDLPNDNDREEIFKVHLRRRGVDPASFDLTLLSVSTEYWNGAEIEHVVEAAMVEAFHRGQPMTLDDLYSIIRNTVPLSRTMAEQIKFIKTWASERAVSASEAAKE